MNTIINAIADTKEIKLNALERYFLEETPCYWEGDVFLADAPLPGFASDEFQTLISKGGVPLELIRINNLEGDAWMQAINTLTKDALLPVIKSALTDGADIPADMFPAKGHPLYSLFVLYAAMGLRLVVSEGEECILRTPKTEAEYDVAAKLMTKEVVGATFTFADVVNVKNINDIKVERAIKLKGWHERTGR